MFRSKTSNDVIDVGGPSSSANENSSPSSAGRSHPSGELLLQWIDHYEEAVTNHYSPELRARVSAVRPNGLSGELLSPPSASLTYRLASKAGGYKVQSIRHFFAIIQLLFKNNSISFFRRWLRQIQSNVARPSSSAEANTCWPAS